MSETVITVKNLSKRYIINRTRSGEGQPAYGTLRDTLAAKARIAAKHVFRDMRSRVADKEHDTLSGANPKKEEFWALKDVSLEVRRGERIGIIGRNGAGKTTLLKLLSRITEPSKGSILLKGRVASLLEVGTGFHPELTGRENIFLNGAILGMGRAEIRNKFDEIVSFAEVEQFIDTPVKRFSSGMYVRLAFSVAAFLEPEILLVDEVLAVGDAAFQKKCLGKMEAIGRQGRTVIFVSHQMQAIENLCNRAICIEKGEIVKSGPVKDVIADYLGHVGVYAMDSDLSKREDRTGTGEYQYSEVWLTDKKGNRISGVRTNDSLVVHALIKSQNRNERMNAFASICFRDQSGFRLGTLASGLKDIKIELNGTTEVFWEVDRFPLLLGDYRCDVYLAKGLGGMGVIDYVLDAFVTRVVPSDYMGTGRAQAPGLDKIFIDFNIGWRSVTE